MSNEGARGSFEAFRGSWATRAETTYSHWCRGEPQNQVQLAFREHWRVFSEMCAERWPRETWGERRALEVGCGRGTISMYFADAGFRSTCLDTSAVALSTGRRVFSEHDLSAEFVVGDALALPFPDQTFDVIVSIGLLEHFKDVRGLLSEQVRVLASGGLFLGYVVPEQPDCVQRDFNWVNDLLEAYFPDAQDPNAPPKPDLYRSDYGPQIYREQLVELGLEDVDSVGMYSMPMISPSIRFPFTLNPPEVEAVLVRRFRSELDRREAESGRSGWLCDEAYGQAFLVHGRRP